MSISLSPFEGPVGRSHSLRLGLLAFIFLGLTSSPAAPESAPSFRTQILPILTKAGCNAGACHGAATGQGGFKLSLLGYDPEEDYDRITRELGGRRVDLESPAESLFLRKPARQLEHEGGRRLPRDSEWYQKVRAWIAAGASYGPKELIVREISVTPADTLTTENQKLQLRVQAKLSDGTEQDVTGLALYTSNDEAMAPVSGKGEVTTLGPGLTSIMVRYSGQVGAARVASPFARPSLAGNEFVPRNFIDAPILAEFKRLRISPSPPSSDSEFLRRVCLDVAGRLPRLNEARNFGSGGNSGNARQKLIEDLLQSGEFVDLWTMRLADLLLINGKRGGEEAAKTYQQWLREQIARNTPWDQVARALLTGTGDVKTNGPANFFTMSNDPRDTAEQVGRIFLGTQIACARCHAHPADRWTQEDYHRFAAFFARISHEGNMIQVSARGEVDHPKTGQALAPKPLGAPAIRQSGADRRVELAAWITAPENPLFARSMVNRVWKYLLRRGLVEPVEDLRPTNPATHPALLEALAADFVAGGYDLRRLIRTIVSSQTYQLSSQANEQNRTDDRFFSHAYFKELPAQVFVDAVAQVTGVSERFEGYAEGTTAVQLVGARSPSYALDVLGRCSRERSCETSARSGGGLAQALHLINGSTINAKLKGGCLEPLLTRNLSDTEIIEELYLRAFSRLPEAGELAELKKLLQGPNKAEAAEDLLWALLNSREFAFNH